MDVDDALGAEHPRLERVDVHGLRQVLVDARAHRLGEVGLVVDRRHEHEVDVPLVVRAHGAAEREAVDAGHHAVAEDDVGRGALDEVERGLPVGRGDARVPEREDDLPERAGRDRVVIDDDDGELAYISLGGRRQNAGGSHARRICTRRASEKQPEKRGARRTRCASLRKSAHRVRPFDARELEAARAEVVEVHDERSRRDAVVEDDAHVRAFVSRAGR